jgi:hypothetical protein
MTRPPMTKDDRSGAGVLPGFGRFAKALTRVDVPDEDRTLSPYTGLTRGHWLAAADDLLLSAARHRSPQGARIDLPGRPSQQGMRTDGLEGFARTFLLAAFRHVGEAGEDPHGHLSRYLEGIVAGTRNVGSDDAESWPVIGHVGRHGQPHVEAASIALSLHLTRSASWDLLSADEQDRLDSWLRGALKHEPSSNNWYLFPLTIASLLEGVGRGDEETAYVIERGLGLIDLWYRGEGWYSDGDGEAFDHYIGWALHLYPLLHARLRADSALEEKLGGRLEEFLGSFARTFDRNGAPLYMGRSMTYRMATLAAVATGEVFGRTPLTHGQSRRVLSAGLRYFLERGATRDGILTLGWHGEHLPTVQRYSGPGSPYWASKGFGALMLPAGHPVWTQTEEALDGDRRDYVRAIAPTGLLIQATASDGLVRVHNHGSDHVKPHAADSGAPDPLYARFAYATRTGPTALHNPSDNDVQLQFHGVWSVRRRIHAVNSGEDWVASWHAPRFPIYAPFDASDDTSGGALLPSGRIESIVVARSRVEVRLNRLVNVPPASPLRLSGWAISAADPEHVHVSRSPFAVTVASAGGEALASQLVGLRGWGESGSSIAPFGTAFGEWAVVPELNGEAADGLYVALASLTADADPAELTELVDVEVSGSVAVIRWSDGSLPTTIDFDQMAR